LHPYKTGASAKRIVSIDLAPALKDFLSADELRRLRIVPVGTRLRQDATYIDLIHLSGASSRPQPR
jgi:hypothetical protein